MISEEIAKLGFKIFKIIKKLKLPGLFGSAVSNEEFPDMVKEYGLESLVHSMLQY